MHRICPMSSLVASLWNVDVSKQCQFVFMLGLARTKNIFVTYRVNMSNQYQNSRAFVREWTNQLTSVEFGNDSILKCFSEIKHAAVQSRDDYLQILTLIECIILKAQVEWVSSEYSKTVVMDAFMNIAPDLKLLSMISLLYELNVGSRLQFVVSLLEKMLQKGCYQQLLIQEAATPSVATPLWDKLISCIASLPDHIANKFQSKNNFPFFHHENFFIFLGVHLANAMGSLIEIVQSGGDVTVSIEFLSLNIGHFCLLGKQNHLFKALFPMLIVKTEQCYIWQSLIQKCFLKIPDRCMDSVLLYIFKFAPTSHCVSKILGKLVLEKPKAKFIILHKLLLVYSASDVVVARNVVDYIGSLDSSNQLLTETLKKLLNVWSSSSAIKHTSYEQHRYITAAILVCVKHFHKTKNENPQQDLILPLMAGMKTHLESPDESVRVLGMIVGEKVTDLINPDDKKDSKLKFEYHTTKETEVLSSLCQPSPPPNNAFYKEQLDIFEKAKAEIFDPSSSIPANETTYSARKSTFLKMAQSQKINLSPQDGNKVPNESRDDDETDSDDELVPFDLPTETPFSKVPKPMYIRDCMDGLIDNKDREHMEIYLSSIAALVAADHFSAKEVAVELCKVLLNLQDNYAIDNFNELRRNAMTSVLVCHPQSVAKYITDEFYSEHYNLQQRMDMLDILVMAAGRLSGLEKKEERENNQIEEVKSPAKELPWKQVVERRIESKTRRFGKKRKPVQSSPDRFGPVAGYFFYPLMAGYDRRIRTMDLLGSDSIILGRLLYALGTILYSTANSMEAEKMGRFLLDFIAQLKRHVEPFVRKACIYCVTMASLSAPVLTQRLSSQTMDAREWLCDVMTNDDDTVTKDLAASALGIMNGKMRKELKIGST